MKVLMLKLQYSGHLMKRAESLEKTLMLGKTEGQKQNGATENLPFVKHGWIRRIFMLSEINKKKNTNTYSMLSFISGLLKTKQ